MAAQKSKSGKLSGSAQVEQFLDQLSHPFQEEIREVRKIILAANAELTEHIKWNAPSFCHHGEDRITFNLHGKEGFRLIFHCGAKVKESQPQGQLFDDATGLLEWAANDRAIAKFTDKADVETKAAALTETIKRWIEATQ